MSGIHYAILLAMVKLYRFETQAISVFRNLLLNAIRMQAKLASNEWITEFTDTRREINLRCMFRRVLQNCYYGWDEVVAGLTEVCLQIIDSCFTEKFIAGMSHIDPLRDVVLARSEQNFAEDDEDSNPKLIMTTLAMEILTNLFTVLFCVYLNFLVAGNC